MTENESFNRATSAALRYISYRPRSAAEVRKRLSKDYPPSVIERVISDLTEQSFLNDSNFAELWANSRDSLKPRSAYMVKRELSSKGIAREIADDAVGELDDFDSAYRAASSHAKRLSDISFTVFKRRMWAFLQRRGYNAAVARQTVSRVWQELESER